MAMLLPVILTWFLATRPQVRYGSWRENLIAFLGHPRTSPYVLTGLAAGLVGVSIFFSLSRGGILSTLGALCLLGLLFLVRKDSWKTGALIILFMGLMLFAVGFLGADPVLERFERIRDRSGNLADLRPVFWKDSINIIKDFSFVGTGFGTYIHIYPRYQTAQTGNLYVDHAHNDFLELLTDGGVIGGILVVWFLAVLWCASFRALRRRKNRFSIFLGLGSFCGMVALGLHSFTDFNFYIGANGLYFFFIAGLLAAASHGRSQDSAGNWSDLRLLPRNRAAPGAVTVGGLLLAGIGFCGSGLVARWTLAGTGLEEGAAIDAPIDLTVTASIMEKAIQLEPLNPHYRRISARLARDAGDVTKATDALVEALRLAPLNGSTLQQLAQLLDRQGDKERADQLMRTGARNDPTDQDLGRTYAAWLLAEGRKAEAFREVRGAIQESPKETWIYLAMMVLHDVGDEELKEALPENGLAYVAYGNYLLSTGKSAEAEDAYRLAIRFEKKEKMPNSKPFWAAFQYLANEKRHEEALQVILGGIELFPADAGLRRTAGTLYEKLGVPFRAIEEYRQALLLDPHNQWVKQRLKHLQEGG
jgi:tetratricopeptide (TPR) repeat protein